MLKTWGILKHEGRDAGSKRRRETGSADEEEAGVRSVSNLSLSLGQPILLLTTRGATTGKRRETPLMYVTDDDHIVVVGSNGGRPHHPAWYRNLRAHPEAAVIAPGRSGRYRAREAGGEERERLWQKALDVYPGYAVYQERAGDRQIPLMVLTPTEALTTKARLR